MFFIFESVLFYVYHLFKILWVPLIYIVGNDSVFTWEWLQYTTLNNYIMFRICYWNWGTKNWCVLCLENLGCQSLHRSESPFILLDDWNQSSVCFVMTSALNTIALHGCTISTLWSVAFVFCHDTCLKDYCPAPWASCEQCHLYVL